MSGPPTLTLKDLNRWDLFLAVEQPEMFRMAVNGNPLNTDFSSGWWTEASMKKITVDPAFVRPGENVITLELDYAP